MLARGQEIQKLGLEREEREAAVEALETELQNLRAQQRQQENGREHLRRLLQDEARQQGELKAQLSAGKAKAEQLTLRRTRLDEELAGLGEQRALEHEQIGEARLQLQERPRCHGPGHRAARAAWPSATACANALTGCARKPAQHKDHAHQLAVRLGSLRAQHDSTRQAAGAPGNAGRAPDGKTRAVEPQPRRRARRRWKSCA